MGKKHRKGRRGKKSATSIKGTMMMLVGEETPKGPGIKMGTTGTRVTPAIIRTLRAVDQPEALKTGGILPGSDKKCLLRTSDQQSDRGAAPT